MGQDYLLYCHRISKTMFMLISACQKIDIYLNPKNKWQFKIAKNFHVR